MKLGIYKHYKNKDYEVICLARHNESLEEYVVYKALYKSKDYGQDAFWVRPKAMFEEIVEIDGKQVPRFTYVG